MKLEFLPAGSNDCPLVRVYDFRPDEAAELVAALGVLASGERTSVAVQDLPGVVAVAGCRLVLRSGRRDVGMVQLSESATFECVLSPQTWGDVAAKAEGVAEHVGVYNWLVTAGDASWLISWDGQW